MQQLLVYVIYVANFRLANSYFRKTGRHLQAVEVGAKWYLILVTALNHLLKVDETIWQFKNKEP